MKTIKQHLYKIVIDDTSKRGRIFDIFIQILIILSVLTFSIETIPNLSKDFRDVLHLFEVFAICIFTIEYILRIFLTTPSWKYIFSFYGIIDLLAIFPYYLAIGIDSRSIRMFRLFRLFRVFKLLKYNKAIDNIVDAFKSIKNELFIFTLTTIFLLYLSSVCMYFFECPVQPEVFKSVFHSFWWGIGALFGYGDMLPITIGGKIFSAIIVFIGIAMVSVPTGLLASAFSKITKK